MNKVFLVGRVGFDPRIANTNTTGAKVANLSLITERRFTDAQGQNHVENEYHQVVAWAKTAEVVENYVREGHMLAIDGRLQTREYQRKVEGIDQTVRTFATEVVAERITLLTSKQEAERFVLERATRGGKSAPAPAANQQSESDELTLAQMAAQADTQPTKTTKKVGAKA
jgi:single-strand DNA-binding protein